MELIIIIICKHHGWMPFRLQRVKEHWVVLLEKMERQRHVCDQ